MLKGLPRKSKRYFYCREIQDTPDTSDISKQSRIYIYIYSLVQRIRYVQKDGAKESAQNDCQSLTVGLLGEKTGNCENWPQIVRS